MLRVLRTSEFSLAQIGRLLEPAATDLAQWQAIVDDIIRRVRVEGDAAVLELTQHFDWPQATTAGLWVTSAEIAAALSELDADLLDAMTLAANNIRLYHQRQMPEDWYDEMAGGLWLGVRHTPLDSVACYVPTSKASLPSSLLMSVVPAQVAGVERIVVMGPARRDGTLPPGVLAAAHLLGISEIYKLGGAVAMSALALGTATIPKVDKLVGPTNAFGMLAKRALFGEVGIDGLNGPSDVTIVADGTIPAAWVAADLLSQAEHGEDSPAILVTADEDYAQAVQTEINAQLSASPRAAYLGVSLAKYGALIVTRDLEESAAMVNVLAPEHLELAIAEPRALLPAIRHAGAIFLGGYAPVPVGDYFAGPSHILPTGRTARFAGGLSVMDFLKRSSLIQSEAGWLRQHGDTIMSLATHEGLSAHAQAIRGRLE